MCGFLRGKPHAVCWPHKAPREIRVRSTPIAKLAEPKPFQASELQNGKPSEFRIVEQVAAPQALRFLEQPIQPLQSRFLHPIRRLGQIAAEQIEGSAYANHQLHWQAAAKSRPEPFPFGGG